MLRGVTFSLPGPRPASSGERQPDHPAGRTHHPDRRERRRENLSAGPAAPVRRTSQREHRGWPRRSRPDSGRSLAAPDRLGPAAPAPVRRHRRRQYRPGAARRAAAGHRGRRLPGGGRRLHPAAGSRLRHRPDRGGTQPVRRAAAEVALARAFLRPAPVLLLDEPTAHLDPASAGHISTVIETQMADRTVVLITHRPPSRAGRTTRVLVLDHGRLARQDERSQARGQGPGQAVMS